MKVEVFIILVIVVPVLFSRSPKSAEPSLPHNWAESFLSDISSSLDYKLWNNELLELGHHLCFLGTRHKLRGHFLIFVGRMWCPLHVDFSGKSLSFDKTMAKLLAINDFMNQLLMSRENATHNVEILGSLNMENILCSALRCPAAIVGDANHL